MKKFFREFKKFITRGNVLDLAVGVIIGGAFGKIVTSLVNNIIMPVVSLVIGGINFADLKTVITPADEVVGTAENAIYWGAFIQNIVDFVIMAFVIFIIVKVVNRLSTVVEKTVEKTKQKILDKYGKEVEVEEEVAIVEPPKPTVEELLTDIKTILGNNTKTTEDK